MNLADYSAAAMMNLADYGAAAMGEKDAKQPDTKETAARFRFVNGIYTGVFEFNCSDSAVFFAVSVI